MQNKIKTYIDEINKIYSSGEATEHSYRGEFKRLCEEVLNGQFSELRGLDRQSRYQLINEPKRKIYGAPDYELLKGDTAIAFIEAKNIGDNDLRGLKVSRNKPQFDRYKNAMSTIAFTDYLSIILYENGIETLSASIGNVSDGHVIYCDDPVEISNFIEIMNRLGKAKPQPIRSAGRLVEKMAKKATLMAHILKNAMSLAPSDQSQEDKELWGRLQTFQKFLVHDMTMEQFVDFYSQTVLYGLFVARINTKNPSGFSLLEAGDLIPSINPFLKKIFKELALAHLHPYVKGIVHDLVLLFKVSDVKKILTSYKKDPLIHFYEDFLESYDPRLREQFGVWYTPNEVVGFIVNSVDHLLKTKLGIEEGLADNRYIEGTKWHKVQILDPATGTGTFLAETVKKIKENYVGQEGLWHADVVDHIIPRMNGFEYLVAPYTMAHLKVATALDLDKSHVQVPDRLNIYLTNSLEEDHPEETLDFARYITDESNAASLVKRESPIMVIIGNPPYKEKSANKGPWIMYLMDDYKQEPGKDKQVAGKTRGGTLKYRNTLDEKNSKGLNNDYCKFIRLGHNFVNRTKTGVMAYICGNTFLKTNIFRGMRYELLRDFDEIYVINLHGSSKFEELTDADKDENIFDIKVGVSINIFVKRSDDRSNLARVYYKDIYGSRKRKLDYLKSHDLKDMDFETVTPVPPFYELEPKSDDFEELKNQYESGFRLEDLMVNYAQGFTTGNDTAVIHYTKEEAERMMSDLKSSMPDEEVITKYGFKDSKDCLLSNSRQSLKNRLLIDKYLSKITYRPFDLRYSYIHKDIMQRPRPLIQESLLNRENLTLCIGKQGTAIGNAEWSLVYISDLPTDKNVNPRGGAYLFPLYIYDEIGMRVFNLNTEIIERLEAKLSLKIQAEDDKERVEGGFLGEDIIDYIYAVLHSSRYRSKYHQFLQNGFPIISYPNNQKYFFDLADKGKRLRGLHLLNNISVRDFITSYPVTDGNDTVTKRKFIPTSYGIGQVWINECRYFDNVPKIAWEMVISGYQPLDKWLKDRNGKALSGNDIRHFQKMVVALTQTASIMEGIDKIIEI